MAMTAKTDDQTAAPSEAPEKDSPLLDLSDAAVKKFIKTAKVLRELHGHFLADEGNELRELWVPRREGEGIERAVVDFLSGMTDRYAIELYERLFLPTAWEP